MRFIAEKIKWVSSSLVVVFLLLVFWVWPAWNSGPQTWYWGNDGQGDGGTSQMYRNNHPPSGHTDPFVFTGPFSQTFLADEQANQMIMFDDRPWKYHIEWAISMMGMEMSREETMMTGDLEYSLSIGRWSNMNMMMSFIPFFSAMGFSSMPGSIDESSATMIMAMSQVFYPGDMLGAMLMITDYLGRQITIPLAQTCYITSPTSDPGYPGALPPIPTVSQWGMLLLAAVVGFLSFTVIRRRRQPGRS